MKIADGVFLTANRIRKIVNDAETILKANGIDPTAHPEFWRDVVNWLRSRRTNREGEQAACHYLGLVSDRLIRQLVAGK